VHVQNASFAGQNPSLKGSVIQIRAPRHMENARNLDAGSAPARDAKRSQILGAIHIALGRQECHAVATEIGQGIGQGIGA
jgi:hypothetical protein